MKKIDFEKLTDEQQEEFVKGFMDADDIGVEDWDSSAPWGCPWFWSSPVELEGEDAYEWGQAWFERNRSEIKELTDEEQEREQERKERADGI